MKQLIEQVLNNNHNIKIKSFHVMEPMIAMRISNTSKEKDSAYHQSKKEFYHFVQE